MYKFHWFRSWKLKKRTCKDIFSRSLNLQESFSNNPEVQKAMKCIKRLNELNWSCVRTFSRTHPKHTNAHQSINPSRINTNNLSSALQPRFTASVYWTFLPEVHFRSIFHHAKNVYFPLDVFHCQCIRWIFNFSQPRQGRKTRTPLLEKEESVLLARQSK